jgi:hypothetical protein
MAKKKLRFPKADRSVCHKDGSEKICSKPTELRAKIMAPVTLRDKMRGMWKEFREKEIRDNEYETLSDSQDFNVENDLPPRSPYEVEGELSDVLEQQEVDASAQLSETSGAPAAPEKSDKGGENEQVSEKPA